jgi:hypothetical protein
MAGAKLRAKWHAEADSHPLTVPLMAHAKQCWREHYPSPSAAGALVYDVASLARHLRKLEQRIAELEGGAA